MLTPEIEATPEQIIKGYEEAIVQQMTLHHIELHNRDLEITKLKRELVTVYSTLIQAYLKNPRAIKVCEDKIREFGGKVTG